MSKWVAVILPSCSERSEAILGPRGGWKLVISDARDRAINAT